MGEWSDVGGQACCRVIWWVSLPLGVTVHIGRSCFIFIEIEIGRSWVWGKGWDLHEKSFYGCPFSDR